MPLITQKKGGGGGSEELPPKSSAKDSVKKKGPEKNKHHELSGTGLSLEEAIKNAQEEDTGKAKDESPEVKNEQRQAITPSPPGKELSQEERRDEEMRKKCGGRRVSDRIKPLLAQLVTLVSSDNITEAFLNLSDEIKEFFDSEYLIVYSIDSKNNQLVSRNLISDRIEEKRLPITNDNLPGYAVKNETALNIFNVDNEEDLKRYPGLKHDSTWDKKLGSKTKQALVVPVFYEKKTLGAIEIINNRTGEEFSDQFLKLAQEMAKALSRPLEKLRQEEIKEKIQDLGLLIQQASAMDELFIKLIDPMKEIFLSESIAIYALDKEKGEIFSKVKTGEEIQEIRLTVGPSSVAGWVGQEKRMVNVADVYDSKSLTQYHPELKFDKAWDEKSGNKTTSMLCCPMLYENNVMGVVQLTNRVNAERYNNHDEKNLITVSQMLAISLYNNKKFMGNRPTKFSYLVNNGFLTAEELQKAIAKARKTQSDVESVLIDEIGIKAKELGKSYENYFGVPYFGHSDDIVLPKRYFEGLNRKHMKKHFWVPIQNDENLAVILIDNPSDMDRIRSIKMIFPRKEIQFKVGLKSDIQKFLSGTLSDEPAEEVDDSAPPPSEDMSELLESLMSEADDVDVMEGDEDEESAITEGDSSIVRLVNKVITDAYDQGVSDIHIEPGIDKKELRVRYRKEGDCEIIQKIPSMYKQAMISRIKIMSRLDIAEKRLPQDGKIKMKYGRKQIELRVATCPTVGGNEDVVMRILAASKPFPLDAMNFSPPNLEILERNVVKPYGIFLVVGPTGSGKTTTLHSCLGYINTPKKKIWTAEDPVEITQEGLRQVQMQNKIGLDFSRAMRSFLRGDPDVIMVGEMRDVETCAIGIEASLTGHLVFSTLHTNSAPETVSRLIDMGMNPINFADALLVILAQRLVKTLCKHCKEDYHPSKQEFDNLVEEYGEKWFPRLGIEYNDDLMLKRPKGCKKCGDSGYSGRTGLHEVMEGTAMMKRLIMKKALVEEIREQAIQDGMSTLKQDGIYKIFKGDCDYKQVAAVCIA
ncbi:MAG: Flp pilus assembly complex ATPase component [Candidatus Nitronauta litoralis]|uniref:Flp pilus assembly complex ATPase component n=1 Tax=Candidatus Nitronauta litoralis TaxID=2705533 RepID=A0A7T0BYT9_9BACT|nr:MAG: Flp pilus assembly complex ATPase component [Candidatus Nitronauta litoralis]